MPRYGRFGRGPYGRGFGGYDGFGFGFGGPFLGGLVGGFLGNALFPSYPYNYGGFSPFYGGFSPYPFYSPFGFPYY
ncbi:MULTISPECIES: hypothetical protein [Sporosarcina]|uniref:Spore coat protein n=1 Tax=Sporosarcina contaminans TaxID=633403 RepID=A0ABW3TYL7_9BACL